MELLTKFSFAAFICSAPLFPLHAQELRLSGGYNGSNVQKESTEQWSGRAGYQFGADLQLGRRFFVKPGLHLMVRNLNYTTVGVGEDGQPTGASVDYRYTSRLLRVPALVGLKLMDPANEPDFNIYVLAGPTALIGLNADLSDDALTLETRSTQWYLGFGGGLDFRFLFLEAGYDVAMSNVFTGEGLTTNPKVNNAYVLVGLRFVLAR